MRNYSKTVGALAAASALVAGNAMAEVEGEVHVGYANMYGIPFIWFRDDVVAVLSCSASAYWFPLGFLGWAKDLRIVRAIVIEITLDREYTYNKY